MTLYKADAWADVQYQKIHLFTWLSYIKKDTPLISAVLLDPDLLGTRMIN